MPAHHASTTLGQFASYLHSFTQHLISSGLTKRTLLTALAVLLGLVWLYKRLQVARAAEAAARQRVPALRDVHGNIMPPNIALGQHAPSPLPASYPASASSSSSSAADDVRFMTPSDRYLTARGSRVRRQTVCVTLSPSASAHMFQPVAAPSTAAADSLAAELPPKLALRDEVVPLLMSLAQHTTLHIVCLEADKTQQEAVLQCLTACELFSLGLARHHVLFCTTLKGQSAILRHIEPNLILAENREMLRQLKPHIDQVVCIDSSANDATVTTGDVPTYSSLVSFFQQGKQAGAASRQ